MPADDGRRTDPECFIRDEDVKLVSQQQYDALSSKLGTLSKNYRELKDAHDRLIAKCHNDQVTIDAWMRYLEKQNPEWKRDHPLLRRMEGPEDATPFKKPTTSAIESTVIINPLRGLGKNDLGDHSASDSALKARSSPRSYTSGKAKKFEGEQERTLGTQSTDSTQEFEHAPVGTVRPDELRSDSRRAHFEEDGAETEADLPIVVSARSLKRKRQPPPSPGVGKSVKHHQGTTDDPIKVKSEHDSSSPTVAAFASEPVIESLDLDEVGRRIQTPRKGPRPHDHGIPDWRAVSDDDLSDTDWGDERIVDQTIRSLEMPPDRRGDEAPGGRLVSCDQQDEAEDDEDHPKVKFAESRLRSNSHVDPEQAASTIPTLHPFETPLSGYRSFMTLQETARKTGRDIMSGAREQAKVSVCKDGPTSAEAVAPGDKLRVRLAMEGLHKGSSRQTKTVLQPTSNNMKLLSTTKDLYKGRPLRKKTRSDNGASKISMVAEDGDTTPVPSRTGQTGPLSPSDCDDKTGKQPPKPVGTKAGRVGPLDALLERRSLNKSVLTPLKHQPADQGEGASSRGRPSREKQMPKDTPQRSGPSKRPSSRNVDGLPLRERSLQHLRPEDFKVNSRCNQGLGYAFTETVRGQERRRCLPGCTRPECCGDVFRRTIQIGGLPTARRSELRWGATSSDDEDERLLEEHLGDDKDQLVTMTADDRQEMLLQARTKQFADKHGRHRNAHERRKTPPGFWRTDMPTTQEVEADRQEADRMERAKVEERYREAMRPGGRWLFADEQG